MKTQIIAANWKMNKTRKECKEFADEFKVKSLKLKDKDLKVIILSAFPYIHLLKRLFKDFPVSIGAQDCSFEEKGAFTGEVSASMLKDVGARYVLVGHSERREFHQETDEICAKKVKKVLEHGLIPIYCFGETLIQRGKGKSEEVVKRQLETGIFRLEAEDFQKVILAYEPVWAISKGDPKHKSASPEDAQNMHKYIRNLVKDKYGEDVAGGIPIIYGGSMKPENAKDLLGQKDIDGGLVGGASLEAESFYKILTA